MPRRLIETLGPSEIATLPFNYGESDDWKDTVMRPKATATGEEAVDDFRTDRFETPQYQDPDDELQQTPTARRVFLLNSEQFQQPVLS